MSSEIEVNGVVLSCIPIGEYDKRVVILTDQLGKIHVFARGARKMNSKFLAGTEPITFAKFRLFSGKSSYNLSEVQLIEYFPDLRTDIDRMCYAFYFLELASYFVKENVDATEVLRLIYVSFKALEEENKEKPMDFVKTVFEWKMFALEGLMPNYTVGEVCGVRVSDEIKYTLDYIWKSKISGLYSFTLREKERLELKELAEKYLKLNVDKKFNSLEMIWKGDMI